MSHNKDTYFRVRCTESDKRRYKRNARRVGLSLSEFVRRSLDDAALPAPKTSEPEQIDAAQRQMTALEIARLEAERIGNGKLKRLIHKALRATTVFTK